MEMEGKGEKRGEARAVREGRHSLSISLCMGGKEIGRGAETQRGIEKKKKRGE